MVLPLGIEFKSQACLVQEFRRHGEIHLGRSQMCVPHVHGQLRQQQLHIFTFAVPRCQSMNCRGMAQVMEARLAARSSFSMQASVLAQLLKSPFECVERDLFALSSNKEWRFCLMRIAT